MLKSDCQSVNMIIFSHGETLLERENIITHLMLIFSSVHIKKYHLGFYVYEHDAQLCVSHQMFQAGGITLWICPSGGVRDEIDE